MQQSIRLSHSCAIDAREAVREFHASVEQPDMALVIFFCSNEYDLHATAEEMRRLFAGGQVIGCTTAGEIGPGGCREHSLAGVSFSAKVATAATGAINDLRGFELSAGHGFGKRLLKELENAAPQATEQNSFAFLLIDGLSLREEGVARALQNALGKIPVVGGSAGDGLNFGVTQVYVDGTFHSDAAVAAVVTTSLPFTVFKTQHFFPSDQRLVITEADPAHPIVKEINGVPAAPEDARVLGVYVSDLMSMWVSAWP